MDTIEKCVLCRQNLIEPAHPEYNDDYTLQCRRCGKYIMGWEDSLGIKGDHPFLRAATRQASELGRPLRITTENWERLIEEHSNTGVLENMERLLNHVARVCKRPGNTVQFSVEQDYPVIDAQHSAELHWHLQNAETLGYLDKIGVHHSLTSKGWDYLLDSSAGGAIPGRCFVAMSFSEEHEAIFHEGIKPAVEDAGYTAVWMKDVLTNEDICHRMVMEIRKAQLLVADFTGLKGGVYFEAGLALGLGREVFWTTHADEMKNVHFDTNHYQHIVWKDHVQLKKDLEEKIVAVMGFGPSKK